MSVESGSLIGSGDVVRDFQPNDIHTLIEQIKKRVPLDER